MKHLVFLLAACVLSSAASAQMRATTKQECKRRCMSVPEEFSEWGKHQETLKQIRDRKKAETDATKHKQLVNDEENEIERFNDKHEQTCSYICANNPEE
jgi:hypothetical protein